ncbi:hypothetical protein [Brevibacillus brevis]|uniref:hypothetical protein n=1 Tax=Brevibacillus brevis TaxID=1393 RepID=UPI0007D8B314|nr:hypothetical protein [Brevibacillus brevis]
MRKEIWVDVLPQPKKTALQRRVERLINKAEKQGYKFSDLDLSMFKALGKEEWDEEKVNFLALQQFERLYARFYTK